MQGRGRRTPPRQRELTAVGVDARGGSLSFPHLALHHRIGLWYSDSWWHKHIILCAFLPPPTARRTKTDPGWERSHLLPRTFTLRARGPRGRCGPRMFDLYVITHWVSCLPPLQSGSVEGFGIPLGPIMKLHLDKLSQFLGFIINWSFSLCRK